MWNWYQRGSDFRTRIVAESAVSRTRPVMFSQSLSPTGSMSIRLPVADATLPNDVVQLHVGGKLEAFQLCFGAGCAALPDLEMRGSSWRPSSDHDLGEAIARMLPLYAHAQSRSGQYVIAQRSTAGTAQSRATRQEKSRRPRGQISSPHRTP